MSQLTQGQSDAIEAARKKTLEKKQVLQPHLCLRNLKKTLNIKGIENVDSLEMPDCSVSVSDLIRWAVTQLEEKDQSEYAAVTRYIVTQAYFLCGEQGGEQTAREMINSAGISLNSNTDMSIVQKLGREYVEMVERFTQ